MSHARTQPMAPTEFLAWEAKQELKWEFDGVRPIAMVGGTAAHSTIQGNLITSLTNRLANSPCQPFGPDMMVATMHDRFRYPDAHVTCTPPDMASRISTNPVVIFEVLSDSTVEIDKTDKLIEYRSIPSLQRYVMLEQRRGLATVIARVVTGWSLDTIRLPGILELPEIGIEIPLAELYVRVTYPLLPE